MASRRRKYGKRAGAFVREEMHSLRRGSTHVRSPEQAVAVGLSRARAAGVRVPLKNPKLTLKQAQYESAALGFSITRNVYGEYVVRPIGQTGLPLRVYYTSDLDDALGTARAEARQRGISVKGNPPESFNVSVTYDVVSPESAEVGDFEETGFEREPEDMTLRDTISLIRNYAPFDSPQVRGTSLTLYQADGDTNYRTGEVTRYAVHVEASTHNITRLLTFIRKYL